MRCETIKCDVCKAVKGDGNKWLRACEHNAHGLSLEIGTAEVLCGRPSRPGEDADICSEACLIKYVSSFIAMARNKEQADSEYQRLLSVGEP
jgi:hypothetical protein